MPVWMASPPEVHSALLNAGPGVGPLLTAAQAWHSLGSEYTEVAHAIDELVAVMRAGIWEGAAAAAYAAAHARHAAWLHQAGIDSATRAARHEAAAAAYAAAVVAMPTPAELAVNHATHAVLVATNFFGINTVPIAINEAEYAQLWIRAATTMGTYHAVTAAELAAAPRPAPAPAILVAGNPLRGMLDALEPFLKSIGVSDSSVAHDPMVANPLTDFIANVLQNFGVHWDPAAGLLNGHVYDYYSNATEPIWYLARSLELFEDFLQMSQNPGQALQSLQYLAALALFDWPTHVAQFATALSQSPQLLVAAAAAAMAPAGSASGLAGLAGLAGLGDLPQPVAASAPVLSDAATAPVVAAPVPLGAPPAAPTPAPAPAPVPAANATAAAPPAAGGPGFFPPYLVAPPGAGSGPRATAPAGATAERKAPEPGSAAAAGAQRASNRGRTSAARRRRATQRAPGVEFMDIDAVSDREARVGQPVASATVSDPTAGSLGFAGTVSRAGAEVAGLAVLADGGLGGGPQLPLVPCTWCDDDG